MIKNYDYYNKFDRQVFAKIVTSEFKEKNAKVMGACNQSGSDLIEESITTKYITSTLIDKNFAKIKNEKGWSSKNIPELFNRIYNDLITEELWNILKEFKRPTINFTTLFHFTVNKIKSVKPELF